MSNTKSRKVAVPKLGRGNPDVLVCAFRVPPLIVASFTTEYRWSPAIHRHLVELRSDLYAKGFNAPVHPLRIALDTVPALGRHVEDKLFLFEDRAFAKFDFGPTSEHLAGDERVRDRVGLWLRNTLIGFAEAKGVAPAIVRDIEAQIDAGDFVVPSPSAELSGNATFEPRRSLVFARIREALSGRTVFPDVEALMCQQEENLARTLVFTSPVMEFAKGKRSFPGSLELRFEMKNVHGTGETLLLVSGGRKSWATGPADVNYRMSAQVHFPADGTSHLVTFAKGEESLDATWFFPSYLKAYETLGKTTITRADTTEASGNSFRVVRPLTGRGRRVGRGLPYYDLSAAVTAIVPFMSEAGFELFAPIGPRPSIKHHLGFGADNERPSFGSKKLRRFLEIADLVSGPAQMDFFERNSTRFVMEELDGHFGIEAEESADISVEKVRRWHEVADRVDFGKRRLAILSMDEDDRDSIRSFIPFYLGRRRDDILVVKLPPGVHGVLPPEADRKVSENERFLRLREAWKPVISELTRNRVTDVLVVAAKSYGGVDEDRINKRAAKYVFADAGISSQYLIPRSADERRDGKANDVYLQRVQSALRDLYFGQQGYADVPADFAETLHENGYGAGHIYAISIVKHNRKIERGARRKPAASLLVCTRLDVRTGLTDAVVMDGAGAGRPVEWRPYATVLRHVAKTPSQKFLEGDRNRQKAAVAAGISRLLDEIAVSDPGAIVMVDPLSGQLQQLWPWLQVGNVRSAVFTDHPDTANPKWNGLTFLVMDPLLAPHMMGRGELRDNFYSYTEVVEKVALDDDFAIYWYQARNRTTNKVGRVSCYAPDREGKKPLQADTDFMMPRPVQLLVRGPGLDADKGQFMATLFKQLRSHHLTYADESTFPSPLFEHQRIKRDMCRLVGSGLEMEFYSEDDDEDALAS